MIPWLIETFKPITTEIFHMINLKDTVTYPYITFMDTTTPTDEMRDEHRVELNLFDYGASRQRLNTLEQAIQILFDRRSFREPNLITHCRIEMSYDVPTGDETIQRRDMILIIKKDRRWKNG